MNRTHCPTCTNPAGDGWMGSCTTCEDARIARLHRNAALLVAHGDTQRQESRAIIAAAQRQGPAYHHHGDYLTAHGEFGRDY